MPSEHFQKAETLLARVDDMKNDTLPIARALVARAQVHATLASCPEWYSDESDYNEGFEAIRPPGYTSFRPLETREATGGQL